ncbi:5-methyltetrahydropteroyltriglutamate--homocysteine S-methyltransferase [Allorhizocola rhizosphaerae]|uniref:5-methyltetrahydropteroyltriglutamate-- homocysteine S-methyltransferase n=1 Tax=Allorhizocola rhizosphaerae TaxID=1872709 RepID=UPI001B8BBA0E|nr:5-methyltetrahydropteroyltriglutamate--homocysteine S-methyltransferase [Allorhizocola rhizosphaerae]
MTISKKSSTVLGYPRIGLRRELKRALESYWDGAISAEQLHQTGRLLREQTWSRLRELGLDQLPGNTFSYYDHVLDAAMLFDLVPDKYRSEHELDSYFAMARGTSTLAPLPMTKWFDTNYHYIVPEIGPSSAFKLNAAKVIGEFREARELGLITRPVLLGPITLLLLSRAEAGSPPAFTPLDRLYALLAVYAELLALLQAEGVPWVQLDEPALVQDRSDRELDALAEAYTYLGGLTGRPQLMVASYFGELGAALPILARTPVEAIAVDLVRGSAHGLSETGKTIVAGVVSGRDVWRTDLPAAAALLQRLGPDVVVSTSCSLLHVPYSLDAESKLDPELRARLAFAEQKVAEVVQLASGTVEPVPAAQNTRPWIPRQAQRRSPYPARSAAQAEYLRLPPLPVTTIGSFPQTADLRATRADATAGRIDWPQYAKAIQAEIEKVIRLQEELGLDVLVHGEPERNDMVQYFAEHLDGFATTEHGWVQSYGSRCTRPPILHGDVSRVAPITVGWSRFAQSLTGKPVKGMLTGPVTIVAWSFKRPDVPVAESVWQVAEALRDEVADLEAAGISIIQVDEPALRELMPLRRRDQADYLAWAVEAYRHATSGASDRIQIHTHLCYSDAATIFAAIDGLDADVTTIESARSHGAVLLSPSASGFERGLGPGVYDIHSPRVPSEDEVAALIAAARRVVPAPRLWVNPDCGLKTRTYPQVQAALRNLVSAARQARDRMA